MQFLPILVTLVAAFIALSCAQQQQQPIFYPALKVRQIPVNINGRIGLIGTNIDLATPLPATRDAQGRQLVTRQAAGGRPLGVQQPQKPGAQPQQQVQGVQFQPQFRVVTPQPPQQQPQQVRGQQLPSNRGQQAPRAGGPQSQQLRVQLFPVQVQQFRGRQFQQSNAGQWIQRVNGPQFQRVGVQTFGQVQQPQQFSGQQQFKQINRPQFGGAVGNGRQMPGGYAHQVWEPSNW